MRLAALVAALLLPLSAHADCVTQEQADAKVAAITKANEASFAAAVAKKKLAPAKLVERTWRQGEKKPPGLVDISEREVNCEHARPEFLSSTDGKIYKVARGPHPTKTTKISVCTCQVRHWGCGGANMGRENVGYTLPSGATYAGDLTISYDTTQADVTYKTADCPREEPPP